VNSINYELHRIAVFFPELLLLAFKSARDPLTALTFGADFHIHRKRHRSEVRLRMARGFRSMVPHATVSTPGADPWAVGENTASDAAE
jgi:hypothetical protein